MNRRIAVAAAFAVLSVASAYDRSRIFLPWCKLERHSKYKRRLTKGANAKAQDSQGRTPLMVAAQNNQDPEVITTLLKAGSDINARDVNGYTALTYAVWHNSGLGAIDGFSERWHRYQR